MDEADAISLAALRRKIVDVAFVLRLLDGETERCAKIAEARVKLRGGAEWALDAEHNGTCRDIAAAIRNQRSAMTA